jgi:hypothetical protein
MSIPNGQIITDAVCVGIQGNVCGYKCDNGYKPTDSVQHITCVRPIVQNNTIMLHWDVQDPCQGDIICFEIYEFNIF